MLKAVLLPYIVATSFACHAQIQPLTEATLTGTWLVSGSKTKETLTFSGKNDFVYSFVRRKNDGKDIPPTAQKSKGAYKLTAGACSAGQAQGNLWMVKESNRCCFSAYTMGTTLVLDELRGSSVFTMPLCESKTLKR